jgi:WD40 repeat protein/serine/threonine protein kinase
MSDPTSERSADFVLLTRLADEFAARYRRGERPSLSEYVERYPQLAADICEVFPALVEVEQVKDDHQDAAVPPAPALQQLGDFRILREVGKGGMGIVYEAEQVSLGRHVALKVLPQRLLPDTRAKRRFEREAKAAAKLHHTNIVPVFGVGEQDGLPYYVMQFIQGLGLDEVLEELKKLQGAGAKTGPFAGGEVRVSRRELSAVQVARSLLTGEFQGTNDHDGGVEAVAPRDTAHQEEPGADVPRPPALSDSFTLSSSSVILPGRSPNGSKSRQRKHTYWQSVASIGVQVAEALEYAHKQGIKHRDIKPSNLLLDTQGTVWVTDFGLAKADDQQNLTHTGDILGTLRYMPPEAFEGHCDARSDVYSLGLTLYELLAFRPAFDERERNRLIKQVTQAEPAQLSKLNRAVPRDLETIVHKAIDKDPKQRYATAGALAEDLQRFIEDEPIQARRVSPTERVRRWCRRNPVVAGLTAALVLVFLVGFAGVIWKWQDAERQKKIAEDRSQEIAKQNTDLEWKLYLHHIALAHSELLVQNVGRAEQLLDECPAAQRGWEWHYLKRLSRGTQLPIDQFAWGIALSPDGKRLATASERVRSGEPGLRLWDATTATAKELLRNTDHTERVNWVTFSPDGRRLATASHDKTVRLLDPVTLTTLRTFSHQDLVCRCAFSPDGQRLFVACEDGTLHVWELATGTLLSSWPGHEGQIKSVAWSPDGQYLASAGDDEFVRVWDAATGRQVWERVDHHSIVWSASFSPDGKRLVSCGYNGSVFVWDVVTGELLQQFTGHLGPAWCVAFTPDGRRVASGGWDRTVKIWDPDTGQQVLSLKGHRDGIMNLTFSRDGRLATSGMDGTIQLWDATPLNAAVDREVRTFAKHAHLITGVAFNPTGDRVLTGSWDKTVSVWDAETGAQEVRMRGHDRQIWGVAYSPDGSFAASGSWDKSVKVWDPSTGAEIRTLSTPGLVMGLAFSPTSKSLAAVGPGAFVKLWDTATWEETNPQPVGNGWRVCFSHDGQRLASGSDNVVGVWDLAVGGKARYFDPPEAKDRHQRRIYGVAFSADDTRLVTTSFDGTIKVWDPESGTLLQTLLKDNKEPILTATFSQDGEYLAVGCADGAVRLFDAKTFAERHILRGHIGYVFSVAFSPDSKRLASSSGHYGQGEVKIWDLAVLEAKAAETAPGK